MSDHDVAETRVLMETERDIIIVGGDAVTSTTLVDGVTSDGVESDTVTSTEVIGGAVGDAVTSTSTEEIEGAAGDAVSSTSTEEIEGAAGNAVSSTEEIEGTAGDDVTSTEDIERAAGDSVTSTEEIEGAAGDAVTSTEEIEGAAGDAVTSTEVMDFTKKEGLTVLSSSEAMEVSETKEEEEIPAGRVSSVTEIGTEDDIALINEQVNQLRLCDKIFSGAIYPSLDLESMKDQGKFYEMHLRVVFTESGAYHVGYDDTLLRVHESAILLSCSQELNDNDLSSQFARAKRRMIYEPEPPRYLETHERLDAKTINSFEFMTMASLTRYRGLTRFEVVVLNKDVTYNSRFLEIQDEHKTPLMCLTDYDYLDADLNLELEMLCSNKNVAPFEKAALNALNRTDATTSTQGALDELGGDAKLENILELTCPICLGKAPLKCKDCLKVGYCSREHQKEDWKVHKKNCVAYELKTNDTLGRHFVARYNIQPGSLIVAEHPLVSGPSTGDSMVGNISFDIKGLVNEEDEQKVKDSMGTFSCDEVKHLAGPAFGPKCLGCYVDLKASPYIMKTLSSEVCSDCGWPLCSSSCSGLENHKLECEYFRSKAIKFTEIQKTYCVVPRVFIALRCLLLKEKKPEVWKILMNMESHCEKRADWEKLNGARLHDLYIVHLLKSAFQCDADVNVIKTVLGILDINALYGGRQMTLGNTQLDCLKRITALYEKASFISHSCTPNALVIVLVNSLDVQVIATTLIRKGEPILIDYDYSGNLRNKFLRRIFLMHHFFIDCRCAFCSDRTEDGLFLNGVTCTKCKRRGREGYLAPVDAFEEAASWKCCKCGFERPEAAVAKVACDAATMLASSMGNYIPMIEKVKSSILHKHNTVLLEAEIGTVKTFLNEDFQTSCRLDEEGRSFMTTALTTRMHVLERIHPAMDKKIVNCRLLLCDVAVLGSEHTDDLDRIKQYLETCGLMLTELSKLFHDMQSYNQYHAFILRSIRIAAARLQQVSERRSLIHQAYHRYLTERLKQTQDIPQIEGKPEDKKKKAKKDKQRKNNNA